MIFKKLIRIIFGLLVIIPISIIGTLLWVSVDKENDEGWWKIVGQWCWYVVSGQWEKLPD